MMMKRRLKKAFGALGFDVVRATTVPRMESRIDDLVSQRQELLNSCRASLIQRRYYHPDIFGNKMFSNPGDLGVDLGGLNGIPLSTFQGKGEIGYLLRTLREGQTVLDIGANIGFFTILFARKVGSSGSVLAFEPGPLSFALLQTNIRINALDQARAFNAAVGNRSGMIDLYICRAGESDNRVDGTLTDHADRDQIAVPLTVVDEFLAERGVGQVDYVKIDVQGAERAVLEGMQRTIEANPRIQIVMEYAPGGVRAAGGEPSEFLNYLRSFGFRLFDLPANGAAREVDNQYLLSNIGDTQRPETNLVLSRDI